MPLGAYGIPQGAIGLHAAYTCSVTIVVGIVSCVGTTLSQQTMSVDAIVAAVKSCCVLPVHSTLVL